MFLKKLEWFALLSCVFALAGCGGGGGGGSGSASAGSGSGGGSLPTASCPKANGLVDNAGPDQQVKVGTTVLLDGTSSQGVKGADPKSYTWSFVSRPSGSSAKLSDTRSAAPQFTADQAGTYEIKLNINGIDCNYAQDTVSVTAAEPSVNSAPQADAGPDQNVLGGMLVKLDGSGSTDADGNKLTYAWSITSMPTSSTTALVNASSATPSFTPDAAGRYVISLVVNDGQINSAPDTVTVTVGQPGQNDAPVANPGSYIRAAVIGDTVKLDGSKSSDANGDPLTYHWRFASVPPHSKAQLSDASSATPSFTADKVGTYPLLLTVNDGKTDSESQSAIVLAVPGAQIFVYDGSNYVPLSPDQNLSAQVYVGANNQTLNRFQLRAVGGQISVTSVAVTNVTNANGNQVKGSFESLAVGDQAAPGKNHYFALGLTSVPSAVGTYKVTFQFTVQPSNNLITFNYEVNVTN
ncbi:MAG: PKD domain-containing protein [Salinisphaera sp.]|jgi:hypothetical protein|nr:PKD domain-containing protein [Salinisphaera sp.]